MLTATQAAARLGITPRRVLALIKSGRLPAEKFGRDWMIREQDLKLIKDRKPGFPKGQKRNVE